MELVGKVLLVWIEPICRASHDGGITDRSLDNCGQKLDGRGLIDIRYASIRHRPAVSAPSRVRERAR
jgi:hypothetical protein